MRLATLPSSFQLFLDCSVLEKSGSFTFVINMSFRRIPFQFSSSDPVERQAELEKRFGLPSRNNMYVDVAKPLAMGASNRDLNQSSSSPRLQHRVPIFVEGYDQPVKSSVDSVGTNTDAKKKPNVRVIPIEIEGADSRSSNRHRTFSGPAGCVNKEESESLRDNASPLKRPIHDLSYPLKVKVASGPKVHNIPIHVEEKSSTKPSKVSKSSSLKVNGCATSKPSNKVKSSEKAESETEPKIEPDIEVSLKKIKNVLEEFKSYEYGVQEFVSMGKDKQYRYLDEMLTRCMLRLDDIETMGNDEVRSARKSAIKKVQACIDLLETKINAECESTNVKTNTNLDSEIQDTILLSKDTINMEEVGDSQVTPECIDENAGEMAENKDHQCGVTVDTKMPSGLTEFQAEILDSQNEVEMEENNSDEKETRIEMISDLPREDMNSEIPEIEMVESNKLVETGSLYTNEGSKIDLSQNIAHSNLSEDKICAEAELSDNPTPKGSCQYLDNSTTTCDVNIVSEVSTSAISAATSSADQNMEISISDQISTEL